MEIIVICMAAFLTAITNILFRIWTWDNINAGLCHFLPD